MQTSHSELIEAFRRQRDWDRLPSKTVIGETVEEAVARGCPYTVIPASQITAKPTRDEWAKFHGISQSELTAKRSRNKQSRRLEIIPWTAEEFELVATRLKLWKPDVLESVRLVLVKGNSWKIVAAKYGVTEATIYARYWRFKETK